ncbi:hypothetical protein IEQ34_021745 [Dendrobium chrysotoxum]|uniref:Uncharacterized protein n=1 Tax=Dendrobium chrysotoxum TaxID=161865 RepID=A0AAV7G6R8_DENCH|nr:hypothetical protein IEQ34_021745 [Dendrobium chrysotoxum]
MVTQQRWTASKKRFSSETYGSGVLWKKSIFIPGESRKDVLLLLDVPLISMDVLLHINKFADEKKSGDMRKSDDEQMSCDTQKFGVGSPDIMWWSGRSPTSGGNPAEVRHQVVVLQKSECQEDVRQKFEHQVVVWRNSGRQMVLRQNSDVRWWSGGTPGGDRGGARRQERSSIPLLLLFLSLGGLFHEKGRSIYRFSRVAWLVNTWKIKVASVQLNLGHHSRMAKDPTVGGTG